jgi:hypothetical protein
VCSCVYRSHTTKTKLAFCAVDVFILLSQIIDFMKSIASLTQGVGTRYSGKTSNSLAIAFQHGKSTCQATPTLSMTGYTCRLHCHANAHCCSPYRGMPPDLFSWLGWCQRGSKGILFLPLFNSWILQNIYHFLSLNATNVTPCSACINQVYPYLTEY